MPVCAEPPASVDPSGSTRLSKLILSCPGMVRELCGMPRKLKQLLYFIKDITRDATFNAYVRGAAGFCGSFGLHETLQINIFLHGDGRIAIQKAGQIRIALTNFRSPNMHLNFGPRAHN